MAHCKPTALLNNCWLCCVCGSDEPEMRIRFWSARSQVVVCVAVLAYVVISATLSESIKKHAVSCSNKW